MAKKDITYVYIDSFNLYYGSLNKPHQNRGTKWLDLEQWLSKILLQNDIQKIKFYTARVSGKYDPLKPVRQDTYFRALKTLPTVEIIEGFFLLKTQKIHISPDVCISARVFEEKGTDVNLATNLVNDAYKKKFDTAIVVSNDSDLAEAVRIVTQEVGLKVGVLNPYSKFNKQLIRYATFKHGIRDKAILASQFPAVLTDKVGAFSKPVTW
jgi:uncharacterized LabA/DUF88 family protein